MEQVLKHGRFEIARDQAFNPNLLKAVVNGAYEVAEISLVNRLIKVGDRVMEFGSGMGIVTMHAAAIAGAENVRGFEANPRLVGLAIANGRRNGFDLDIRNRLVVGEEDVASGSAERRFFVDQNFLASSVFKGTGQQSEIAVASASAADEIAGFAATFIVADIEGGEIGLFGGSSIDYIRAIVVELHPAIIGVRACIGLLEQLSRRGFNIDLQLIRDTVIGLCRSSDGQSMDKAADQQFGAISDYLEASVLSQSGRYREASAALRKSVDAAPAATEFHLKLAEAQLRIGEPVMAVDVLERIERTENLDDNGLRLLGLARLRNGQTVEAGAALARLSPEAAAQPHNQVLLARVATRLNRLDEARTYARAAAISCPWTSEYSDFLREIEQRLPLSETPSGPSTRIAGSAPERPRQMHELVLHIGLPKTATSFIQKWLVTNAKPLRQRAVWVPPRQIHAHRIAVEAITNSSVAMRDDVRGILEVPLHEALSQLIEAAPQSRYRSFVISSEYFYEADPQTVRDRITSLTGLPVRIVVMLRRQDRIVESGYNQSIKAMGMIDPVTVPRYLANLDWFELIGNWASAFGGENITVLNYDDLAMRGTILPQFLQAIDAELAKDFSSSEFTAIATENESLPADLLEFKRIANGFGEFGLQKFLCRLIETGHKGPTFRIPEDKARDIIALYQASNDRVARDVLGTDQPLFGEYGGSGEREGVNLYGNLPTEALAKIVALSMKETGQTISALKSEITELKALIGQLRENSGR